MEIPRVLFLPRQVVHFYILMFLHYLDPIHYDCSVGSHAQNGMVASLSVQNNFTYSSVVVETFGDINVGWNWNSLGLFRFMGL